MKIRKLRIRKFKIKHLNHYTIEKGIYLADIISYNLKTGYMSVYSFLRYDGRNLGFSNKKKNVTEK